MKAGFSITHRLVIAVTVYLTCGAGVLRAQEPQPSSSSSQKTEEDTTATSQVDQPKLAPLAAKEQMIRDRFKRFQDRLFRLSEELAEREPQNAARLSRAISRAGELGLSDKLEAITEILEDQSRLYDAAEAQGNWMNDADRLLGILLERDSDNQERRNEIERLEEYRKRVSELLEQQQKLRDAAAASKAAAQMRRAIEQAIQQLEQIQTEQRSLEGAIEDGKKPTLQSQYKQKQLADRAKKLAEQLEKMGESGEQESQAQRDALNEAREKIAEASQKTQSGSKSMSQAGEKMKSGNQTDTKKQQQDAEQMLKEARKDLQEAKKSLEDKSDTGEQAGEQNALAEKAQNLSTQMKQSSKSGGQQDQGEQGKDDGQEGDSQPNNESGKKEPGKKTPGQQSVERAQSQMKEAGESLEKQKPDEAIPKEDRALEELQQAQKELDELLEQLRKEEKEETLRDLESRFREMLTRQKPINEETLVLANIGRENFSRPENLQLADLSARQRALSEDAAKCLHILDEDGTTIAFPRVVEQLSEDMSTVAQRLSVSKVATITQTIEQEIVDTLEELLDAVQEMQQQNEQQQSGQQQQNNGEPPLLPKSAELKLLRASQQRINTRTLAIEQSVSQGTETPKSGAGGLKKLATRQVECLDIAREMRDRPQ